MGKASVYTCSLRYIGSVWTCWIWDISSFWAPMDDCSQPDAEPEAFIGSKPKSRQQRWNERHKALMAEVQARYRKSSEHYKRKHAGYQRTYMAKVRSNPRHPIEPDPWLT